MVPAPQPVSSSDRSPGGQPGSISSTLLERVQAQRPEAWERLVDLYGPSVYRWCRRWGVGPEDTADLVQEVFAAVATHVQGFRRNGQGSFTAWLATITRNKIRDHFRRQGRHPQAFGGTDARQQIEQMPEPIEPSEIAEAERSLPRRGLELVRAEFENRTWEAFWRTTVDGRPPSDVADELGMTLAAVYKAKSRVLRRLRRELGGLLG
ncbi:MAG: sigma-70 family RNA polymerase sigma factor [Pirellulales bacterium]|nr:sigma-70 family RNA polymerase sigma factor [Pirellulales bacterium]